jgi:hypothetical protein
MKGFTLIETIIYIALLTALMGGTTLAAYQIIQASSQTSGISSLQGEGGFVLRKIGWALSGAQSVSVGGSSCSRTMHVVKHDGTTTDMRRTGTKIEMRQNAGAYHALTTDNVSVSCLEISSVSSGTSVGLEATITMSGKVFTTTKYIRQ